MTADKLQNIVLRLANAAPTRYWLHFNYPCQAPWLMAIRVRDEPYQGSSFVRLHGEMKRLGFAWDYCRPGVRRRGVAGPAAGRRHRGRAAAGRPAIAGVGP